MPTPLINSIIPKAGFELVRDAIGVILLTEITEQKNLQGAAFPEDINILMESLIPTDSADAVTVNILLAKDDFSNMTQFTAEGMTLYYIDISTSAQETSQSTGSQNSAFLRDKYLRMITYIFRSALYRNMGLAPGLVMGTYLQAFETLDPIKKEDTDFTSFARIQLAVRINESAEAWPGVEIVGHNADVKLDLTDKGYKFVFNY